jgi:hypothetical protein
VPVASLWRIQMQEFFAKPIRATALCLFLVIGCAGVLDLFVARSMSTTYDEPQSVAYGEQILRGKPDRSDPLFNSKSPITALNAIPRLIAGFLDKGRTPPSVVRVIASIRVARLASIVAALLLNVIICRWVYSLYGAEAAVAISILVIFSPNLIAHGTLANNDGYFACGVIWALFCFRRYVLHPTFWNTVVSGISLAVAQLTKPFAIYLYLVVVLLFLLTPNDKADGSPLRQRKDRFVFMAIAAVCLILMINIGFSFDRLFTPLKSYQFESKSFERLQAVPVLSSIPLPLPYPFLQGLDMLKYHDDSGLTYGKIYLRGELRDPLDPNFHNFKSYYAVAIFFKEPIAVQVLFCLGLVWIWRHRSYREFVTGEGMLLIAATILFAWFSLFRKSQLGIRNILPVVAVELIIAGAAFAGFSGRLRRAQVLLGCLVAWACLSVISYYPDEISYMNEWVMDRKQSYKILVDSNLDYGQEGDIVHEFLLRNPDVALDPERPVAGRVLVSVNRLVGEWHGYEPMHWLLRYQPAGRVGYGHLLYVVPEQDIPHGTINSAH